MRGEDGFTLVEVLVALVIASIALAALFRGGIDGMVSAGVAGRMEEAMSRAQSRLAALCHGARLAPGRQSGDDGGGFTWASEIAALGSAVVPRGSDDEPKAPLKAALFGVQVTISWGGRELKLATSCLALGAAT